MIGLGWGENVTFPIPPRPLPWKRSEAPAEYTDRCSAGRAGNATRAEEEEEKEVEEGRQ